MTAGAGGTYESQAELSSQRGEVHGVAALADRLAGQRLNNGDRLGGLGAQHH